MLEVPFQRCITILYHKICTIAISDNIADIGDITIWVKYVVELSEFYNQKNVQVIISLQS